MSHLWPFLRDTVYSLVFYGFALYGFGRSIYDVTRWALDKLEIRRRREERESDGMFV